MRTHSLKAYEAKFGSLPMEMRITDLLIAADGFIGAGTDPKVIKGMARMFMDDFGSRPAGCVVQAIRDGVKTQTVGHKLTYPILCQWMNEMDARVEAENYNQYLATK